MESKKTKKILLGVTGASGQIYALKVLQIIQQLKEKLSGADTHQATQPGDAYQEALQGKQFHNGNIQIEIVFTDTGKIVWEDELGQPVPGGALDNNSYYHPFASGSNAADVMIILPATMGTVGRIACGATADLLTRAADVMLKERRPLIICPRETPFNLIHLRNLTTLAEAGALIAPASPSFYTHPKDMEELTETFARRIINLAGVNVDLPKFL
ncbi:MAG: UbiX family flavin prenyltransferase [Bacteroidales bacterium]|nr:UbiX family flavin prenyltransferase [Bacteroidales bacterium]